MGAWGSGSFENDTAMDWAAAAGSIDAIEEVFDALADLDSDVTIDADDACRVVAAAEAVAVLMGRIAADVPEDLQARLGGSEASSQLIANAQFCLERVWSNSELAELWAEGDPAEWNLAMTGLIARLNPELPFDPPPQREEIEKRSGYLTRCVFCDGDFAEGDVFNLEFRDYSSSEGLWVSRGLYCHLPCLNSKLHPRHLLQNWKFDPDAPSPFANLGD